MTKPMLAMMGVTAAVWVALYAKRLPYLLKHQIDPQSIRTPDLMQAAVPEQVQYPAYNLRNLFELPVLFYMLCLATMQLQAETPLLLGLAWLYVALRALHSMIHCSYNRVAHRFAAYFLSTIALWLMVAILAYQVF
ncbi:MAG: MAPEG family protein [Moraxellaceae bacterium]